MKSNPAFWLNQVLQPVTVSRSQLPSVDNLNVRYRRRGKAPSTNLASARNVPKTADRRQVNYFTARGNILVTLNIRIDTPNIQGTIHRMIERQGRKIPGVD